MGKGTALCSVHGLLDATRYCCISQLIVLRSFLFNSSKEFLQTKDVATHAFTSLKIGLRAQHLGFHRALCVLMGWDTSVASNDRWICKSLPDVQAWAMKDDIIVWPPVVIIHNGSPRDLNNSNEQVKISIEQLEDTLKGKLAYHFCPDVTLELLKFMD